MDLTSIRVWIFAAALALAGCGPRATAVPPAPAAPPPFVASVEPVTTANTAALNQAFEVAFGVAAPATVSVATGSGKHQLQYLPAALIDLSPNLVALISNGEGNFTNYICAACAGQVSVDYLRRTANGGFAKLGHWDLEAVGVSFGLTAPWTLRTDLDDAPLMLFATDEAGQGCTSTMINLVALAPAGAIDAGQVVLNSGRQVLSGAGSPGDYQYAGKLTPIARGRSFAIDYSGARPLRVVFTKGADGKFGPPGGDAQTNPPVC
jgi:hypothetical protein